MFIKDGIAHAGEPRSMLSVRRVRPLKGYRLFVQFSDDQRRIVDMSPLLERPAFQPLKDKVVFDGVYLEHGLPLWQDGDIDIAPEWLCENGQAIVEANLTEEERKIIQ